MGQAQQTKLMDAFLRVFAMLSLANKLMDAFSRVFAMLLLAIKPMDAFLRVFAMLLLAIKLMDAFLRVFAVHSSATKLMGAISSVLLCSCVGSEGARVGSMRRTSSMKPAYWYGCRPRGLPSLGLVVRAYAGGARPPFQGRNLRSSLGSSFGRVSKGSEGKRFDGEKREGGGEGRKKNEKDEKKKGAKKRRKKSNQSEPPTLVGGWSVDFGRGGLGQVSRNPNGHQDFCLISDVVV
ncbi:uncharacterized protein BJ212DRAFT_1583450 [Suillus subaureus]|uniref:Uncharacterized protein n=1 Tax=Suillus subaureus TaxID=48587 RepID=A0A9P7ALN4_9AGAM|nr:uncharacterized protein BJ212DRAFT_1583450 [Suillus subaureus]KAG1790995.1 hypothetical protein BJ212DRAFT_1583450 [Suillus subaureus]